MIKLNSEHHAAWRARRGPVLGAWISAACISLAVPFVTAQAATKSLESSPGSGFVISADFEDLRAGGALARNRGQFTLKRPADREESSLLKFLSEYPISRSGAMEPIALLDRMKWGDLTLFSFATRSKQGEEQVTLPVRCVKSCSTSLSMEGQPGISDPQFPLSTFAYFQEERTRILPGELPRARSFPVTLRVLPENLPPASPFPITFRVDVRLAFAAKARPPVYDFASRSWRGKLETNQAEWQGLITFLAGLRKARPAGVASYLNKAFSTDQAQYFVYAVNDFTTKDGALNVTSTLVEPDAFAAKVSEWKSIVPLGTVQDGPAVRLLFSTSAQLDDVQQMPIRCGSDGCRVTTDDWINYVQGVIQHPALLRLYRSMFQKAATGSAGQQ